MRCRATTKDGKSCCARPLAGRDVCIMHSDPSMASQLGHMGGLQRARREQTALLVEFAPPRTPEDLRGIVAASLVELRAGKMEARTANAIGTLAGVLTRILDQIDLDARIRALESNSVERTGRSTAGWAI